MDLEQLETFVQVAELGSFTRASNANAMHAVLSLIALPADAASSFFVRPIGTPPLAATLWIATSAERPRGALLEPAVELVAGLMRSVWAMPKRDSS